MVSNAKFNQEVEFNEFKVIAKNPIFLRKYN